MDIQIIIVLAILLITVFLLVFDLLRIDLTAMLCLLMLAWTGVLDAQESLSGFSSNAVIAMLAVMIMGHGISKSGIMDRFSRKVVQVAGDSRSTITGVVASAAGLMSAIIQNIGAAALLLPAILNISRRKSIPPSKLIMPVGFAAILGGTLTMVGSGPLILINDLLGSADLEGYGLFAVTPVGLVLLTAGITFFLVFGKWFLPAAEGEKTASPQELIVDKWQLPITIRYFTIPPESDIKGRTAEDLDIWDHYHVNVLGVASDDKTSFAPWRKTAFEAGQTIALLGEDENINAFAKEHTLTELTGANKLELLNDPNAAGFAEIMIPPRSEVVGKTLRELKLRKRYSIEPLRLIHNGSPVKGDFSDVSISAGDTFIIYGLWSNITEFDKTDNLVLITKPEVEKRDYSKARYAILTFLLAIAMALGGFSISTAFLTGAIAMVLTGVLRMDEAYRAVDWKVVFFLAGLIPLGVAMQKTGTAEFLAEAVMRVVEGQHLLLFLLAVAGITTLFSLFMSNVGATVILAPLVIGMAEIYGIDPRPVVLLVAVSAANSFLLPTHQVNALYKTPGGYKNSDYLKAGGGLTLLFLAVVVAMFYLFYL